MSRKDIHVLPAFSGGGGRPHRHRPVCQHPARASAAQLGSPVLAARVQGVRLALAENGGGALGNEEAMRIHVLER